MTELYGGILENFTITTYRPSFPINYSSFMLYSKNNSTMPKPRSLAVSIACASQPANRETLTCKRQHNY